MQYPVTHPQPQGRCSCFWNDHIACCEPCQPLFQQKTNHTVDRRHVPSLGGQTMSCHRRPHVGGPHPYGWSHHLQGLCILECGERLQFGVPRCHPSIKHAWRSDCHSLLCLVVPGNPFQSRLGFPTRCYQICLEQTSAQQTWVRTVCSKPQTVTFI